MKQMQLTELMEVEADCGLKCAESLEKLDQNLSLSKTFPLLQKKGLTKCYKALPKSGMIRNGQLLQPLDLVRHTCGNEFGLWLTPAASDGKRASFSVKSLSKRSDSHHDGNLAEQYAKKLGKRLCPELMEYMMGYPEGWTMLDE